VRRSYDADGRPRTTPDRRRGPSRQKLCASHSPTRRDGGAPHRRGELSRPARGLSRPTRSGLPVVLVALPSRRVDLGLRGDDWRQGGLERRGHPPEALRHAHRPLIWCRSHSPAQWNLPPHSSRASYCEHGQPRRCTMRHDVDDTVLGTPMCTSCFDYRGAVLWNANASRLFAETMRQLGRQVASARRISRDAFTEVARINYLKVAEVQRRGLMHFTPSSASTVPRTPSRPLHRG
jgi:hypothetical protein